MRLRSPTDTLGNGNRETSIKKAVENDLLTIDEVAASLKVSKMTLWRWSKSGRLKKVDIGGVPRYRRSDIENLLNNNDNVSNLR